MSTGLRLPLKRSFPHGGHSPSQSPTFGVKKNKVKADLSIGNCCLFSEGSRENPILLDCSPEYTSKPQDQTPPMNTSGKTKQVLMERDSSLARNLFGVTPRPTGHWYGNPQLVDNWKESQMTFSYVITGLSKESLKTTANRFLWTEVVQYFGGQLELANRIAPGMKPVPLLTLKIHSQNGGVDIKARNMLSLMNFEEYYQYPISYGGWTDIRSLWRRKEELCNSEQNVFGSPVISNQTFGTPTWTRRQEQR